MNVTRSPLPPQANMEKLVTQFNNINKQLQDARRDAQAPAVGLVAAAVAGQAGGGGGATSAATAATAASAAATAAQTASEARAAVERERADREREVRRRPAGHGGLILCRLVYVLFFQ